MSTPTKPKTKKRKKRVAKPAELGPVEPLPGAIEREADGSFAKGNRTPSQGKNRPEALTDTERLKKLLVSAAIEKAESIADLFEDKKTAMEVLKIGAGLVVKDPEKKTVVKKLVMQVHPSLPPPQHVTHEEGSGI